MSKPITTWRAAAAILGICEDTLCKRRKLHRCRLPHPHWRDEDAVWEWYNRLMAPPEEPVRPTPQPKRSRNAPRELTRETTLEELLTEG